MNTTNPRESDYAGPCPRCGGGVPDNHTPGAYPGALSRKDNATYICSQCGQEEALYQFAFQVKASGLPPLGRRVGDFNAEQFSGLNLINVDAMQSDYGRWLIHGPQGSGKTSLAATIAEAGPTLFIDLTGEKGIRSIQTAPFSKNVTVVRPTSVTALDDLFWKLNKGQHQYQAVVLDSLTALQKMVMRFLLGHSESAVREIKQGTAPADIRTWGQALDVMTDTATFWFGLADGNREKPMHVVMTAQTKVTEDEMQGSRLRTPDVQKGALSITLAAPDYIVYTDVEENMDAISDDSLPPVTHIVRFGANPDYRTKARLPYNLRGKIPAVLGRKQPVSLMQLSRVLGIGGIPTATPKEK